MAHSAVLGYEEVTGTVTITMDGTALTNNISVYANGGDVELDFTPQVEGDGGPIVVKDGFTLTLPGLAFSAVEVTAGAATADVYWWK